MESRPNALAAALIVTIACAGPLSFAQDAPDIFAAPEFQPDVVVLSKDDVARITSRTNRTITFKGYIPLSPGDIVAAAGFAFKVVSVRTVKRKTVIRFDVPSFDELLERVHVGE
jgi:hypothetical protein